RAATQRMAALIDDLLHLARVSRAEVRRAPIDLTQIAHATVAELRQQEPERRVDVRIEEGLRAEADGALITVALANLIGNAWKFTARTESARIEFGARHGAAGLVFFVRDNGAGFDMAYAHKLFGVFQRLHRQEDFPGTGVGLATVNRIVRRHGGRIWAESRPGQETTFFFTLG